MCRSKGLGGRRCPQHTDPVKHAAYNQRRRELYAAKKNRSPALTVPEMFQSLTEVRTNPGREVRDVFIGEARQLTFKLKPDFDEGNWKRSDSKPPSHEQFRAPEFDIRQSLLFYTEDGFGAMRYHLNQNPATSTYTPMQREWLDNTVNKIDAAFDMVEQPAEPRKLYRGVKIGATVHDFDVDEWVDTHFPVGGVISQKNYMSTSMKPSTALNFSVPFASGNLERSIIVEIVSKQGIPLGMGTSNYDDDELEVLMPRNAKFKVVSVDKNVKYSHTKATTVNSHTDVVSKQQTVVRLVDVNEKED